LSENKAFVGLDTNYQHHQVAVVLSSVAGRSPAQVMLSIVENKQTAKDKAACMHTRTFLLSFFRELLPRAGDLGSWHRGFETRTARCVSRPWATVLPLKDANAGKGREGKGREGREGKVKGASGAVA